MAAKTMSVEDILAELRKNSDEARAANEKRYGEILGTYENAGRSAKGDVDRATSENQATIQQELVSRGLGQSTVLEAAQGEAGLEGLRQKNRIDEDVAASKAGVMERRTDAYPDQELYATLLSKIGQGASSSLGQRHEFIGGVPGGDGFGGGGGGGFGGGGDSGSGGGGSAGRHAASMGGGGGGGDGPGSFGRGSYSSAAGRAGALPGGGVQGFYGSYSGEPGAYGGSALTGSDAVRFGGAGTTRVSIPPMIGMGSYYGAGGGGSLGSGGSGYAGSIYNPGGGAGDESDYFTEDSGYADSADGSPEAPTAIEASAPTKSGSSASGKERKITSIGDPSPGHGWKVVGKSGQYNTIWERA